MNKIQKLLNRITPPVPEKIEFINYAMTNLCNSRCTTCNIWQLYKPGPHYLGKEKLLSELTAEDITKGFRGSRCFRSLKNINLTGGEPFIKKDFTEIALAFHSLFPSARFNITSNGLLPEQTVQTLQDLSREGIHPNMTFSIDGLEKEHDRVRGVAGGFGRTMRTIASVKKELPELPVTLSFTINPTNYRELPRVFRRARELGIGLITRYALVNPSFYFNKEMKLDWEKEELEEAHNEVMKIKREKSRGVGVISRLFSAENYFFNNMTRHLREPKRDFDCYSGTHGFFMDPYGNIKPCYILGQGMGNIKEKGFDEIWLSEKAGEVRNYIKERKCHCWTECDTIPSLEKNNLRVIRDNMADAFQA